ncbi:MAG: hypothetical protein PVG65_05065 [Candidatus Thorarchaeota archaeon]|jgi:hypothetical protein
MGDDSKKPGPVMKFIQDYRMKMLIPELLVVFGVWYLNPDSLSSNVYEFLGLLMYICQPIFFLPSGILAFVTAFTLHGIYPLDNYHEGKIAVLPKAAVIMIIVSLVFLPVLVLMQMIGYYMTEATEYFSRNPLWERFESFGDLFFYAGAMFFVGLQWWLFIPTFFLSQGIDGIHKIAHHETSSEPITAFFYFLFPISMPFFFNPVEIMAMAALSIPAFAFYSYIRPYYTYVTSVHTITFAILVILTTILSFFVTLPLINIWFPGFVPEHVPPRLWW